MTHFAIETRGLSKRFGSETAVDDLDLVVEPGSIYGFLGPNGAGKTTTIRLLLGLLRPSGGEALLFGENPVKTRKALRNVGAMVETPSLYDNLTGRENLAITRRLLKLPKTEIDRALELVDLTRAADKRAGKYSLGMRQRLGVARALMGSPKLVILDEPSNGLDPHGIRDMRALVRELPERAGATVFVSSHILSEVEQTATHIGLMKSGSLIFHGSLEELRAKRKPRVTIRGAQPEAVLALLAEKGVAAAPGEDGEVFVDLDPIAPSAPQAADVNRMLVEAGVEVHHLALAPESLETLFMTLTGPDDADPASSARIVPFPTKTTMARGEAA